MLCANRPISPARRLLWNAPDPAPDHPPVCPGSWPSSRPACRRFYALVATAPAAGAADADLARNGGFEAGLDGWSCTGGSGTTVSTPVHGGTSALKATPAGSDNARCSQTVTVKPDSAYTLGAWVQGSYVYLGASGTGTTDVSTWTQSASTRTDSSPRPSGPAPPPHR